MSSNKLTLKLTGEQQKQIKDATGKSIGQLHIDLGSTGGLSDTDLDKVTGGALFDAFLKLDGIKGESAD